MKIRHWGPFLLLLVGALVYGYRDFQIPHPVWFNWLFAVIALAALFVLPGQCQNKVQSNITSGMVSIIAACAGLPLLLNITDGPFYRDAQRAYPGMSRAAFFQQMAP